MKIVKQYPDGVFSWVDLSTTDLEGAHAFYSGLFGWEPDNQPLPGGGSYTNFRIAGYSVAGGGEMMPEMKEAGAPPVWTSYVNHSDIDAVCARAAEAGGVVFMGPMDVMDQGRLALIQDPTGAPFGVWQPGKHVGAQVVNQPNSFVWNELQTRDPEAASAFYDKVFGWTNKVDANGYMMWYDNDRVQCGAITLHEDWGDAPSHWMVYFLVDDVDDVAARAVEMGGQLVVEPMPAGELGRMAVLADPQGAYFTVIRFNGSADEPPGEVADA
jgi:predicted enzyme related to lactoylglutathione lyase